MPKKITLTLPDDVYNRWVLAEAKRSYKSVLPNLTRNPRTLEQHAEYCLAVYVARTAAGLDTTEKIAAAKHDFATAFAQAVTACAVKVEDVPPAGPPAGPQPRP